MASVMLRPGVTAPHNVVRDGGRLVVQTWLFTRPAAGRRGALGRHHHRTLCRRHAGQLGCASTTSTSPRYGYVADNDIAFFPGWPLVLRGIWLLGVPMLWAGVAVAVICSGFAAAALHRLGGPVRRRRLVAGPDNRFHLRALHRGAVLRGRVLGLGTGRRRDAGARRPRWQRSRARCESRGCSYWGAGDPGAHRGGTGPSPPPTPRRLNARQPWHWPWLRVTRPLTQAGRSGVRWPWRRAVVQSSWPGQPTPRMRRPGRRTSAHRPGRGTARRGPPPGPARGGLPPTRGCVRWHG